MTRNGTYLDVLLSRRAKLLKELNESAELLNCNECDVLIHEAYTQASFERVSSEWKQYREAFHLSLPGRQISRVQALQKGAQES